jgi:hypothetical protein
MMPEFLGREGQQNDEYESPPDKDFKNPRTGKKPYRDLQNGK